MVLGHLVIGPKMAHIAVPDMGPLKNGFSRNPSLKPKNFVDGPVNGTIYVLVRGVAGRPDKPPNLNIERA